MHFHIVDAYQDTGSILHQADARIKLILALLLILLIGLTPFGAFAAYIGFFALMMAGAIAARIDPALVVKRSLVALPFAGAAVTLIFTVPGETIGIVPILGWPISEAGLVRFASILFKSIVSVQAAVLLMLTTHFTDVLWAAGALRVPKVLVAILSFMYRYIFVLADEALRLTRARDSRSATLPGSNGRSRSWIFQAQTTGRLIGSLMLRSFARSERVYQAMVSRGYRGELRRFSPPPLTMRDLWVGLIPAAVGVILLLGSILLV